MYTQLKNRAPVTDEHVVQVVAMYVRHSHVRKPTTSLVEAVFSGVEHGACQYSHPDTQHKRSCPRTRNIAEEYPDNSPLRLTKDSNIFVEDVEEADSRNQS